MRSKSGSGDRVVPLKPVVPWSAPLALGNGDLLQAPRAELFGRRGDPHAAAAGLFVYQEMAWLALVTRHKSLDRKSVV